MKILESIECGLHLAIKGKIIDEMKIKWDIKDDISYSDKNDNFYAWIDINGVGLKCIKYDSPEMLSEYHRKYTNEIHKITLKIFEMYRKGR